jgi:hypothetical protein
VTSLSQDLRLADRVFSAKAVSPVLVTGEGAGFGYSKVVFRVY